MVFSSYYFVFYFLPVALGLYYLTPRRGKHFTLLALSYLFYGWTNPLFIVLLWCSTFVDFIAARVIALDPTPLHDDGFIKSELAEGITTDRPEHRTRRQRIMLGLSIVTNLSILGTFKYANFLTANVATAAAAMGFSSDSIAVTQLVLPLGLSFYTLQSMSYTIDVYRGKVRPCPRLIDFACYVAMFPQLVAGPIVRFGDMGQQLANHVHKLAWFSKGAMVFSIGLAKKVLLANPCGELADAAFDAGAVETLDAWLGATAYACQIYFDFSGYSDMAIGLGLMLGFTLPINFNSPYRAHSMRDFWRRWHISLSTWLRDYLYIPLGGNRKGRTRQSVNVLLVMLIGGIWHGADWTFVIWGLLHGFALALESIAVRKLKPVDSTRNGTKAVALRLTGHLWVIGVLLITWVFFRAESLPQAMSYLQDMFGHSENLDQARVAGSVLRQPFQLGVLGLSLVLIFAGIPTTKFCARVDVWRALVAGLLLWASLFMLSTQPYNPFIYFIF